MKILLMLSLLYLLLSCSTLKKTYLLNDKTDSKYYLINIIKDAQKKNKLGKMPMLIINSTPIYYHYKKNPEIINIKKDDIKSINITESSKCTSIFGKACIYGLIEIKTY